MENGGRRDRPGNSNKFRCTSVYKKKEERERGKEERNTGDKDFFTTLNPVVGKL